MRTDARQGMQGPLRVTPLRAKSYLGAKLFSLGTLALAQSVTLLLLSRSARVEEAILFLTGILFFAGIQVFLGALLGVSSRGVRWSLGVVAWIVSVLVPGAMFFIEAPRWLSMCSPGFGPTQLILGSFVGISTQALLFSFAWTVATAGVICALALRAIAEWIDPKSSCVNRDIHER